MASHRSLRALQTHEAASREALAKKRQQLAQARAQLRTAEKKALDRRRYTVGKLVLDTVLGTLSLEALEAWILDTATRCQMLRDAEAGEGQGADQDPGTSVPGQCLSSLPRISNEIHKIPQNGSTD